MDPSQLRSKFERQGLAVDYGEPLQEPTTDLYTLLSDSADAHPDGTALVSLHQPWDFVPEVVPYGSVDGHQEHLSWTYAQLQNVSDRFAAGMIANGVSKGMAIAAFLYTDATCAMALWAAARLACPFVPLNPHMLSNPQELQHVLKIVKVEAVLVSDQDMAASLERNAPMWMSNLVLKMTAHGSPQPGWMPISTLLGASYRHHMIPPRMSMIAVEDTAIIVFTSGTTALPKGCPHNHKGLMTGVQIRGTDADVHSGRRTCVHSPSFHVANLTSTLGTWAVGGTVVHPASSFDAAAVLHAVQVEKCTNLNASPSAIQALLSQFSRSPTDTSSLKSLQVGSSMVLAEDLNRAREILGIKVIHSIFGMSEGVPLTVTSPEKTMEPCRADPVSVGTVCAEARLRICAPHSVTPLRRGEVGELHVGGPQVIPGYVGGVNGEAFYTDEEGAWLISGDQAMMDMNGQVTILGRYKDIIISGGVNISPAAIEAVLQSEASLNAQVVGVTDDLAGQVPVAVYSEPTTGPVSALKVRQVVAEKLGARCAPAQLISLAQLLLEDFPKTSSGKVRKFELAAAVQRYRLEDRRLEEKRQDASIREAVMAIWADLLGLQVNELTESTRTRDIADSLTMIKFLNRAERAFRVLISMQELLRHNSIAEQVRLVRSRQGDKQPPAQSWKPRSGPPTAADMVHTLDGEPTGSSRREIDSQALQPLGLSWEDVEDVLPMYDNGYRLFQSGRRTHRQVWMTNKASVCGVRDALEATLANNPMLRATAVTLESSVPLYVIIRSSPRWIDQLLSEHSTHLNSVSDLQSFLRQDTQLEYLAGPCPLFRAVIVHVHESNAAGFVLQMNHSIFDGISIAPFFEDLDGALSPAGNNENLPSRTPYKLWADNYFLHRSSIPAKVSAKYHIDRLKRLPRHVASLFPKVQGDWYPTSGPTDTGVTSAATPLHPAKPSTTESTLARLPCSRLSTFCRNHDIAAAVVAKASIAILNTLQTRQSHAVFASTQAGRSWPFLDDWITERLPNPIDVAGPTLQNVINLVEINPEEGVLDLLNRMQLEQNLQTKHCHAPMGELRRHFGLAQTPSVESTSHLGRSGDLVLEGRSRQIFNWQSVRPPVYRNLQCVQIVGTQSVGLLWNCNLVDVEGVETLRVEVRCDSEMLSEVEVGVLLAQLGVILTRMTEDYKPTMRVVDCYSGDKDLVSEQTRDPKLEGLDGGNPYVWAPSS